MLRRFFSPHYRLARHAYAVAHPLAISVALGAAIAGLAFLVGAVSVSESSLAEWLPSHFLLIWSAVYSAGGAMVVYGIFSGRPNVEAPGFVLLGIALLTVAVAIATGPGLNPGGVVLAAIGPTAIGCITRAVILTFVEPKIVGRDS